MSLKMMLNDEPPAPAATLHPQAPTSPLPSRSTEPLYVDASRHSPPRSYGGPSDFASRVSRESSPPPGRFERLPSQSRSSHRTLRLTPPRDAHYRPSPPPPPPPRATYRSDYPPQTLEHEYHNNADTPVDGYHYSTTWGHDHRGSSAPPGPDNSHYREPTVEPISRPRRQRASVNADAAPVVDIEYQETGLDSAPLSRKKRKLVDDTDYQPSSRRVRTF